MPEANNDAVTSVPLLIPDDIRYNCTGCGRCCTGWAVGLTEADYSRVKDIDWGSLYPQLKGKELFTHREKEYAEGLSQYPHHTKTAESGGCSFLIDNLCVIHSTLGEDAKPGMCKLFPYTFVPTPSGIFVGVSHSSMAAVRNMGELLSNQRPLLEKMWTVAVNQEQAHGHATQVVASQVSAMTMDDLQKLDCKLNLVAGVPLAWREYLSIETPMLNMLQDGGYKSIFHSILAMGELLADAVRRKSAGEDLSTLIDFKPKIEQWMNESPGYFENLVFNILCFRNFVWPQLNKQYSALWTDRNKSPLSEGKVVNAAVKTVMLGSMDLPGLGKVNINKARKMKMAPVSHEIDTFLRRHFYLKIFGKTYCGASIAGFSVIAGFNNLVGNFLSAITYAKLHAQARRSNEIAIADLYEAFLLIDRENVALSQLPKDKASFYDTGFSSARLFSRLLGQMSALVMTK
jgi:Fe-S-cluster containining protein